ncbi:hypothetical protein FA041_13075 [Escherichia coli]|nr:hypothetical protein [Escherichia coli]
MPTEGAESPGGAQLTFIARRDVTPQPPQTPQALLEFAKANPGTVTYPRPPDFTGTAFLEQLLIMLTPDPTALKKRRTMRLSPVSLLPCGNILMRCIRICGAKERISRLRPRGWMLC